MVVIEHHRVDGESLRNLHRECLPELEPIDAQNMASSRGIHGNYPPAV
jgi:hypothetical protein